MDEKTVTGGDAAPLAVRRVAISTLFPVDPTFLLGYFDLAITGALEYPRYVGVYLAPWWDMPGLEASEGVHGWKRSVLKRVAGAGAEHWGHMFLVAAEGSRRVKVGPGDLGLPLKSSSEPVEEIQLRAGEPRLTLHIRATSSYHREELRAFAEDVAERFRRQLD